MAITKWDDYLIHQIGRTVDTVGSDDPHFIDRFFWAGNNSDGTLFLMTGLGVYPNVNVMDGFFSVLHKGIQRNIRISRHLNGDRADTVVGPLSFKVIEPLKRWRLNLGDNDYGLGCSLEFEGRVAPYLYPELALRRHPMSHYTQLGYISGSVIFEGQQFNIDRFPGVRDRSWGIRRTGIVENFDVYFWLHAHFSNCSLSLIYIDTIDDDLCLHDGAIFGDDGTLTHIADMRHRIEFIPGSKFAKTIELILIDDAGKERHAVARLRSSPCCMGGGGYDDRHGVDLGPFHVDGERWDISQRADFEFLRREKNQPAWHFIYHEGAAAYELDGEPGVGIIDASFGQAETWQYKPTL